MTTRTFRIGPHVWFNLTNGADDKLAFLEEHTWREGGGIRADAGKTLEQTFVDHAAAYASGDEYKAKVREAAEKFLTSDEHQVTV